MQDVTTDQFLADARIRLGAPSLNELSDAALRSGLAAALRDYTKARPWQRQMLNLTLQPYQEWYFLPAPFPFLVIEVVPAAPTTASARAFGQEFRALELDLVSFNIADLEAFQYKVSQYRELFEQIEWYYNSDDGSLFISPSPVNAMQAIVIVANLQSVESAPDSDYEPIMYGTMSKAQEIWADQRDSLSALEAPSALGTLTIQNGDKLRELSKDNWSRFKTRVGWDRPFIGQG